MTLVVCLLFQFQLLSCINTFSGFIEISVRLSIQRIHWVNRNKTLPSKEKLTILFIHLKTKSD